MERVLVHRSRVITPALGEICPQLNKGVAPKYNLNVVPPEISCSPCVQTPLGEVCLVGGIIHAMNCQIYPTDVRTGIIETGSTKQDFLLMVGHCEVAGRSKTRRVVTFPINLFDKMLRPFITAGALPEGQHSYLHSTVDGLLENGRQGRCIVRRGLRFNTPNTCSPRGCNTRWVRDRYCQNSHPASNTKSFCPSRARFLLRSPM